MPSCDVGTLVLGDDSGSGGGGGGSPSCNVGTITITTDDPDPTPPPDPWNMSVECVSAGPSEITVGETFTVEFAVTNETNDIQQYTLLVIGSGRVLDETDSDAQGGDTRTHSFTIEAQSEGSITPVGQVSER